MEPGRCRGPSGERAAERAGVVGCESRANVPDIRPIPFSGRGCGIMTRGRPSGGAHMAVVDPFVPLGDWRTSLYRGDPAVVDRFLDTIDATLPLGWVRDREY